MNSIRIDAGDAPLWIPLIFAGGAVALVVAAVIVGLWWRRGRSGYGRRRAFPIVPLMTIGTIALGCVLTATAGFAAVSADGHARHVSAVRDAVYEEYGISLTDAHAEQLKWPITNWTSLDDRPTTGRTYGRTEVIEGEKARTMQLAWDGNAFVLRVLSERSVVPGQPLHPNWP